MKKLLATLFCLGLFVTTAEAVSYFPSLDPPSYLSAHITTDATTLVKTGPGSLRSICVNTPLATGTVTVDDAITATTPTLAVITTPTGQSPFCQTYNISFTNGLTIVTGVAVQDITVNYQ